MPGNVVADPDQFEFLQVDRTEGNRLWVRGARCRGWILENQVVTGDAAIEYFNSAIKNDSQNWYLYTARGLSWQMFRRDLEKAIADYSAAIKLSPRDLDCYHFRGQAYFGTKNYDKAIADFNRAVRIDPDNAHFFHSRGEVWIAKKDYENAIADFDDAIRRDPQLAAAHNARAWLLATCPSAKNRDGKRD